MMKVLIIALKNIKENFKRPLGLILLILGPVVLMFILGQAFSGLFTPDENSAMKITLGYWSKDKGPLYNGFEVFVNHSGDMNIQYFESPNPQEGKEKTSRGEYDGFVVIEKNNIKLFLNNNKGIKAGIIEGLLNGFLQNLNWMRVLAGFNLKFSSEKITNENYVIQNDLEQRRQPRSIDYFGITILTMAILYGAHLGSYGISKERSQRTLERIFSAPVRPIEFFAGSCLGNLCVLFIQMITLVLLGKYLLGIYYGQDILPVIFLLLTECFFVLALGTGLAGLLKNTQAANGILNSLLPVLLFLGGSYMKLPDTPGLNLLSKFSPIYWLNDALFETIYGGDKSSFLPAVVICLGSGLVIIGLGVLKSIRSERV